MLTYPLIHPGILAALAGAGHGFISSQAEGLRVLASIPSDAPLVVAEGVWQFSQ